MYERRKSMGKEKEKGKTINELKKGKGQIERKR